jgi:1-acyl-sn-glycerol-3-phosphate acyltransferase
MSTAWPLEPPDPFYQFFQWLPQVLWRAYGELSVEGRENVPASGPLLVISNHQSNLDPILIQATCPRVIYAMAKSTQFSVPFVTPLMKRLHAYPVRRYQTDPQAVRLTLRHLQRGRAVGIYIEGERSWDGRLQAAKPGTTRIALKAGVPVIPCTISGSYDAWPRWDRRIRPGLITVRFGPALHFPKLDRRAEREAALPVTTARIMEALTAQLAAG